MSFSNYDSKIRFRAEFNKHHVFIQSPCLTLRHGKFNTPAKMRQVLEQCRWQSLSIFFVSIKVIAASHKVDLCNKTIITEC